MSGFSAVDLDVSRSVNPLTATICVQNKIKVPFSLDNRRQVPVIHKRRPYRHVSGSLQRINLLTDVLNDARGDFFAPFHLHHEYRTFRLDQKVDLAPPASTRGLAHVW